jgi:two-component system cell cycle response regulator
VKTERTVIPDNQLTLYRSITRRYLLAVLIIAFLSGVAFYTLQSALSDSDSTAHIVNLSGRQRMLSQHIALDAHRLHKARFVRKQSIEEYQSQMARNISDMRDANRRLSSGVLSSDSIVNLSPTVRDMYFGEMDVHNRVIKYLEKATQILESDDSDLALESINWIDERSEQLLKDLNKIVNQYQLEGEGRLLFIEQLEVAVLLLTIIVLTMEVLFIFRPMAKEVIAARSSEARTLENLQDLVELRTIKLENSNKKLKELASHDPLTELRNRLAMEMDLERLIDQYRVHSSPFAVAMVDIDHFKVVNDNHGHPAGDHVLKLLSSLFKDGVRESDHVYRSGGEEFIIILHRLSLADASGKMEQLRINVSKHHFDWKGQAIPMTISLGLYHTELFDVATHHELMITVDEALYKSKNNGRNRLTLASQMSYQPPEPAK